MSPTPVNAHLAIGSLLGMEHVDALRLALLGASAEEWLVVDLEGGDHLHGAAFQLLVVLVRDRAAENRITSIVNATPAIEALLTLAGFPDLLPARAPAEVAAA